MDLARNLIIESVSRLNPPPPVTAAPSLSASEAAALMRENHTGCVLVCDRGKLVGIFTERDLVLKVMAKGRPLTTPLKDCMSPDPATVQAKEPIGIALRKMQAGGYRHLPVVGEDGLPVGFITVNQIVHYIVEHFPASIYNLPPSQDLIPSAREGA
jgi:CBS domain-containing protein